MAAFYPFATFATEPLYATASPPTVDQKLFLVNVHISENDL
jgi:hypothetical protein